MIFSKKTNISKIIIFFAFLFVIFNNFLDSSAYAASSPFKGLDDNQNAIITVLCNVTKLLTGGIARMIAMIAIVVVAVGLFMGKFSWGVGLATAIGIAMIFGASTVVDWLAKGIESTDKFQGQIKDFCN